MSTHKYSITDYRKVYQSVMQFNKNKSLHIHQWYPFVEGYSKEFITSILEEINYRPKLALDPFAGSGTTAVELQYHGIECISYEVSPFMHLLASTKLEKNYTVEDFLLHFEEIKIEISKINIDIREIMSPPIAETIQEGPHLKNWLFNWEVMTGLLELKYAISKIKDEKYQKLFRISLAAILLDVSNVYRNGKCLSYKKGWKNLIKLDKRQVQEKFYDRTLKVIYPDIEDIEKNRNIHSIENLENLIHGDVRKLLKAQKSKIDLVITSPPYLNTRDYTDIYRLELWMLDLIDTYENMRLLRHETIRSHVQIHLPDVELLNINELQKALVELEKNQKSHWNPNLVKMIKGYFEDMNILFSKFDEIMDKNGMIFFNVANSAFYGVEIKVDSIIAEIAQNNNFNVLEIREARRLRPSSQQKDMIDFLRESVIVMKKK